MVNAVVVAGHRDHWSPRERLGEQAQQGDEVGRAALAQPVHQAPVVTSIAPYTATCRFLPGPPPRETCIATPKASLAIWARPEVHTADLMLCYA